MADKFLQSIIFPHIHKTKQRKEIPYIFCYNIRYISNPNLSDDHEYKAFNKEISSFIIKTRHQTIINHEVDNVSRNQYLKLNVRRDDGANSVKWDITRMQQFEKNQLDSYLLSVSFNC